MNSAKQRQSWKAGLLLAAVLASSAGGRPQAGDYDLVGVSAKHDTAAPRLTAPAPLNASVTVAVNRPWDAPSIVVDRARVLNGAASNASVLLGTPAKGRVAWEADGALRYTAPQNSLANDAFECLVLDRERGSFTVRVEVAVIRPASRSWMKALKVETVEGGRKQVTFLGTPFECYRIEVSERLNGVWRSIGQVRADAHGVFQATYEPTGPIAFFRSACDAEPGMASPHPPALLLR